MAIDQKTMHQILENVFGEMLCMPVEAHASPDIDINGERVVARITISGELEQELAVHAPIKSAANIASVMFDTPSDALDESEIDDAIGEVANMIAGSVKGSYQQEAKLSLPQCERMAGAMRDEECETATAVMVSGMPLLVSCSQVISPINN